jgi:hypothetical protein
MARAELLVWGTAAIVGAAWLSARRQPQSAPAPPAVSPGSPQGPVQQKAGIPGTSAVLLPPGGAGPTIPTSGQPLTIFGGVPVPLKTGEVQTQQTWSWSNLTW